MQDVRRIYIYVALFASLIAVFIGAHYLLGIPIRAIAERIGGDAWETGRRDEYRRLLSRGLPLVVVGGAVGAVHLMLARQGLARAGDAERQSFARGLYLAIVLLFFTQMAVTSLGSSIGVLLQASDGSWP